MKKHVGVLERAFRRFDHGPCREVPHDPHGHEEARRSLGAGGVLERLGASGASLTDLPAKFHMTITGMKKHVGVLERAAFWNGSGVPTLRSRTLPRSST